MPCIVAYGLGRDSTAMLVEMHRRGWRPDAITWANTGSEHDGTYAYFPVISAWLETVGFPAITVVQYNPVRAPYQTVTIYQTHHENRAVLTISEIFGKSTLGT